MAIPISDIVSVSPRFIAAGQTGLELNGLFLSDNHSIPVETVLSFSTPTLVGDYFGFTSDEYKLATRYFKGYDNSTKKPSTLYFSRWVTNAAGAAPYIRSNALGLTLDELQALTGVLEVTIEGVKGDVTLNFNTTTSFSQAAEEMQAELRVAVSNDGNFTSATVEYDSLLDAFIITGGEKGAAKTIAFCEGSIATGLKLTEQTGAALSQGADTETPATVMDNIIKQLDNFVTFSTISEISDDLNLEFAIWSTSKNVRFLYVIHSTDTNLLVSGNTVNIGSKLIKAEAAATCAIYGSTEYAAFIMGTIASINYNQVNGAITLAFKKSAGLIPNVTDSKTANSLSEKRFNFYGDYSENNTAFQFLYDGKMYGDYKFIDTYINAVWLNARLQLAGIELLTTQNRIAYNTKGYAIINSALNAPLTEALRNGVCDSGVTLSNTQVQQLNLEASFDLASILSTIGYYIEVSDPGASARGQRLTPTINLWYAYAGAVQKLVINSTVVE